MSNFISKKTIDLHDTINSIEVTRLHTKPASEEETMQRHRLVAEFNRELQTLIKSFAEKADLLGGYYRGPGIKAELNRELSHYSFYTK